MTRSTLAIAPHPSTCCLKVEQPEFAFPGTVAKTTVLVNSSHAPWRQGEFARQKAEMLALAMDTLSCDDPWFLQYCEAMCFDRGLPLDTDPGVLFEALAACSSFTRSGIYVSQPGGRKVCNASSSVDFRAVRCRRGQIRRDGGAIGLVSSQT